MPHSRPCEPGQKPFFLTVIICTACLWLFQFRWAVLLSLHPQCTALWVPIILGLFADSPVKLLGRGHRHRWFLETAWHPRASRWGCTAACESPGLPIPWCVSLNWVKSRPGCSGSPSHILLYSWSQEDFLEFISFHQMTFISFLNCIIPKHEIWRAYFFNCNGDTSQRVWIYLCEYRMSEKSWQP